MLVKSELRQPSMGLENPVVRGRVCGRIAALFPCNAQNTAISLGIQGGPFASCRVCVSLSRLNNKSRYRKCPSG